MRAFVVAGPEDVVSDGDLTQRDDSPGAARARQGGQGGRPVREAKEGRPRWEASEGGQRGRPAREASEGGQRGRPAREASEGGEGGGARDCLEVGEPPPPGPLAHAARQAAELHSQMAGQPRRQQPTVSWPTPVRLRRGLTSGDGRLAARPTPTARDEVASAAGSSSFWGCSSPVGPAIAVALLFRATGSGNTPHKE
jgi:hypothetical protein